MFAAPSSTPSERPSAAPSRTPTLLPTLAPTPRTAPLRATCALGGGWVCGSQNWAHEPWVAATASACQRLCETHVSQGGMGCEYESRANL